MLSIFSKWQYFKILSLVGGKFWAFGQMKSIKVFISAASPGIRKK
jgi:glucose uptake protein GlcU